MTARSIIGGEPASLGVDAVWGEMTDLDRAWLERKLKMYELLPAKRHRPFPQDRRRQAAVELRQSRADREEAGAVMAIDGMREGHGAIAMPTRREAQSRRRSKARAPRRERLAACARAGESRYILGHSQIFTPEVINDIHIKSELGRYRMRGFSLFKKIPHWDDLTFLPGTLTRFVIEGYREKCETKTVIGPRPSGRWSSTSRSMSPA